MPRHHLPSNTRSFHHLRKRQILLHIHRRRQSAFVGSGQHHGFLRRGQVQERACLVSKLHRPIEVTSRLLIDTAPLSLVLNTTLQTLKLTETGPHHPTHPPPPTSGPPNCTPCAGDGTSTSPPRTTSTATAPTECTSSAAHPHPQTLTPGPGNSWGLYAICPSGNGRSTALCLKSTTICTSRTPAGRWSARMMIMMSGRSSCLCCG
jgi:hypothetical protein